MISIEGLNGVSQLKKQCDLGKVLLDTINNQKFDLKNGDILCISSKMCSIAYGNIIDLNNITPSKLAKEIHEKIPRKSPELIQVILDRTEDATGNRIMIADNYIGGWLPTGLFLTSAGVDRQEVDKAIVLPENCDLVAREIGERLGKALKGKIAIVITDSDGRVDKKGANQVAVGLYGIDGLRKTQHDGKKYIETLCDMLASTAGLVMGQRGVNIPVVRIRGVEYGFHESATIEDAIN